MTENVNILDELKLLNSEILINSERTNVYHLPEGFFDDLSNNVSSQIWINSVSKKNLYLIPEGYFENLSEIILDKIWLENNSNKNYYFLPDGYFENLAGNILKKISHTEDNVQQELEELSPLLNSISKTNVFSVPPGYFDALTPLEKSSTHVPAKVISLGSRARKWVSYAAAACVAGLMFIGGYSYLQNKKATHINHSKNQFANVDVNQAISQLSDTEINNYLNNDNSDIYNNGNSGPDNENFDIKIMLDNTSDDEINNYLLQNSEPAEKNGGI